MKDNYIKGILVTVVFGLVVLLGLQTCKNRELQGRVSSIDSLMLANQKLDSMYNSKDQVVYTQKSIITDQQEAIDNLAAENFNLTKKQEKDRKTIAYLSTRQTIGITEHDTIFLDWDSSSYARLLDSTCARCADSLFPLVASDSTVYYKADLVATKHGISVNNFSYFDSTYIRFSELKRGFFGKRSIEAQILHTNPYVVLHGANSVYYVPKKKPKLLLKALIFGAGIFIGTKL